MRRKDRIHSKNSFPMQILKATGRVPTIASYDRARAYKRLLKREGKRCFIVVLNSIHPDARKLYAVRLKDGKRVRK